MDHTLDVHRMRCCRACALVWLHRHCSPARVAAALSQGHQSRQRRRWMYLSLAIALDLKTRWVSKYKLLHTI